MNANGAEIHGAAGLRWIHPGDMPYEVLDRRHRLVCIDKFSDAHYPELTAMYDGFEPKGAAQGLPPDNAKVRDNWLRGCVSCGTNLLAFVDGRIVGHSMLAPIPPGDRAEFGIFIHQDYQNVNIGTNLTIMTIFCGYELGYERIWLCVEQSNARAIAMYNLVGFKFTCREDGELCMELDMGLLHQ